MAEQMHIDQFPDNNSKQQWNDVKMSPQIIPDLVYPVVAPGVFSTAGADKQPQQQQILTTPEYVFQSRVHSVPPVDKERQRTVQACDKCRERKTKCSGDRPVCQRCTARGLLCNYSSREPRTRGPSKARLRNAISSTELRNNSRHGTLSPQGVQQNWQLQTPPGISRHYRNLSANYNGIQRAPSLPSSRYDQFKSGIQPGQLFDLSSADTCHEPYMSWNNLCGSEEANAPLFSSTNSIESSLLPNAYHSQTSRPGSPRDVRRVQSHSALLGKNRPDLHPVIDPALCKSSPIVPQQKPGITYPFYTPTEEQFSPESNRFLSLPHTIQNRHSPYIEHLSQVNPDIQMNWGYQSDGGSTGSDGMEHNLMSSPSTSSEGIPESHSRGASSLGAPSPEPFDFLGNGQSMPSESMYGGLDAPQNMQNTHDMTGDRFMGLPNTNDASFPGPPYNQQMYGGFINPAISINTLRATLPQFDEKGQQVFHD